MLIKSTNYLWQTTSKNWCDADQRMHLATLTCLKTTSKQWSNALPPPKMSKCSKTPTTTSWAIETWYLKRWSINSCLKPYQSARPKQCSNSSNFIRSCSTTLTQVSLKLTSPTLKLKGTKLLKSFSILESKADTWWWGPKDCTNNLLIRRSRVETRKLLSTHISTFLTTKLNCKMVLSSRCLSRRAQLRRLTMCFSVT